MNLFVPLLPGARRTNLLRAILLDGDDAVTSWSEWCRGVRDVPAALARDARPLLPLLYDSVRRNAIDIDERTATHLRSAYVTESMRSKVYGEVVATIRETMQEHPFVLVKGGALRATLYREPALRHAHDVELLVDDAVAARARLATREVFSPRPDGVVHASGLPVRLHERLPIGPVSPVESVEGIRTPDATDSLSLALVHAARWISRASMQWACDAVLLSRSGAIDGERFRGAVRNAGAERRVRRQLTWLQGNFATAGTLSV